MTLFPPTPPTGDDERRDGEALPGSASSPDGAWLDQANTAESYRQSASERAAADAQAAAEYAQHSATGYGQAGFAQPGYAEPGYAQPGYAEPGYAQPGYAEPGYQQAYAQPGYQQAYAQPGYAQPGYGAPGAYAYPVVYAAAPKPAGNPLMGILGIGLAVVALAISVIADFVVADQLRQAIESGNETQGIDAFAAAFIAQLGATVFGIAGLVFGIVGTVSNKGRTLGIFGIVVASIAPFISYFLFIGLVIAATGSADFSTDYPSPTTGA